MQERKYEIGDDFFVVSPNLGDGEVRSIVFSHPNVVLKIYAPTEGITFSVELDKVSSFSFNTDHPQNVIEGIRVYPDRESMRLIQRNMIPGLPAVTPQALEEMLILIEPIAGPTLVCTCKTLRIFLDD